MYRSSKLSNKVDFIVHDEKRLWKEKEINVNWKETNPYYIHHIGSDILVWNDVIGTSKVAFENYIYITIFCLLNMFINN